MTYKSLVPYELRGIHRITEDSFLVSFSSDVLFAQFYYTVDFAEGTVESDPRIAMVDTVPALLIRDAILAVAPYLTPAEDVRALTSTAHDENVSYPMTGVDNDGERVVAAYLERGDNRIVVKQTLSADRTSEDWINYHDHDWADYLDFASTREVRNLLNTFILSTEAFNRESAKRSDALRTSLTNIGNVKQYEA